MTLTQNTNYVLSGTPQNHLNGERNKRVVLDKLISSKRDNKLSSRGRSQNP